MTQKNAPAAGGHQREGEDQNTREGEPIMTSIPDTTHEGEPIRPVYGPSDPRWGELAAYMATRPEDFNEEHGNLIDALEPNERGSWHAKYILGRDWREIAASGFTYPDFPDGIEPPAWATTTVEMSGVQCVTDFPTASWFRDLPEVDGIPTALVQEAAFDPETKVILWDAPFLSVWADGDTQLRFTDPVEAIKLARALFLGAGSHQNHVLATDARPALHLVEEESA